MDFILNINSASKQVIKDLKIEAIVLPSLAGEIKILSGHSKLYSMIDTGIIKVEDSKGKHTYASISRGIVKIDNNVVDLLAETLELRENIDKNRALLAKEKAEKKLMDANISKADEMKYKLKLLRSLTRIKVSELN